MPIKKKNSVKEDVENQILFENLCDILLKAGTTVRLENGSFRDGLCKLNGTEKILFVNKKHCFDKRTEILISHLKTMDHQQFFLPPLIRQKLETNQIPV